MIARPSGASKTAGAGLGFGASLKGRGVVTVWVAAVCACAGSPPRFGEAPPGGLQEAGLRGADDPTVAGARLFPGALDEAHGWGIEPGGGVRAIVAGVRFISMPNGAMLVAGDRLAATPSSVVPLPERMGGGFLFGIGPHLWRADRWLGPARALFTSSVPVSQVLVGLDRVYLRSTQGALAALGPGTGSPVGLGPLPASPNIGRLAAFDAWHAVAVADLRGALMTHDAGSTWDPVMLPIEPSDVVALTESIAVGGLDETRQVEWWEVLPDGRTSKLSSASRASAHPDRTSTTESTSSTPALNADAVRAFGPRPLASAIEDGWPLADGTALVARNGALGRVRLADGALMENVPDAFPLNPARCHALSLGFDKAMAPAAQSAGEVGVVCGEPRGRTIVYQWDARSARLVELRRFETPREVLGFGNGALAVRGPCTDGAAGDAHGGEQAWCFMPPGAPWRETRFPSDARLVVLADGRTALVHPPRSDDLSTARLTVIDGAHRTDIPLALPPLRADVASALLLGVWMNGFEERRPGVVGGWVDAAGSLLGVEIAADGETHVGEYIRDAGAPVASGRWAFGWTASRLGFETTNGGMTWAKMAVPDPIASGRAVHERACGPVGCIAAGWLRVGWGATEQAAAAEPVPRRLHPAHPSPTLDLDCEPIAGADPGVARANPAHTPGASGYSGSIRGVGTDLPPFAGEPSPSIPADDLGLSVEASGGLERALHAVPLARVYAWGPKTGEWDPLGRWQVRWQWPWGGRLDVRSSTTVPSPWSSLDAAGRALGAGPGTPTVWVVAEGDDPDHALLLAHHAMTPASAELFVLESGRPPAEARQSSGDPIPDVESATRVGGRWYVATAQSPGELAATVIWSLDGAIARELVRVPRGGFETRPALRLAQHTDGRAIGLLVDGQTDELRGTTPRWIASVDVESSSVSTPEPLAPSDLSDRTVSICTGDDTGWEVDLPYPGAVRLRIGTRWESTLQAPVARMRLSREGACVDRVLGSLSFGESTSEARTGWPTSAPRPHGPVRTVDVGVLATHVRYALRCAAR